MDEPVEERRMSSDPTPKVKTDPLMFAATFEGRRLSIMFSPTSGEMCVNVRGDLRTNCAMFIDKAIIFALTHWLQTRIAEM